VLDGVFFFVSQDLSTFPPQQTVISAHQDREPNPTSMDIQYINATFARRTFGKFAWKVDGLTWLFNGPESGWYLSLLYAIADVLIEINESFTLSFLRTLQLANSDRLVDQRPNRIILTRAAGPVGVIPRLLFPGCGMVGQEGWSDYTTSHRPFIFNTVALIDPGAAKRNPKLDAKMGPHPWNLLDAFEPLGSDWWQIWRHRAAVSLGFRDSGYGIVPGSQSDSSIPVITYIPNPTLGSKEEAIISKLKSLEQTDGYEVRILRETGLTRIRLALRSKVCWTLIRQTFLIFYKVVIFSDDSSLDAMWMEASPGSLFLDLTSNSSGRQESIAKAVGIPFGRWNPTTK